MDWRKLSLLGSIGLISWMLMIQWTNFEPPLGDNMVESIEEPSVLDTDNELPSLPGSQEGGDIPGIPIVDIETNEKYESKRDIVVVETDVFDVTIDLNGGDIIDVKLHQYLTKSKSDGGVPLQIMQRSPERFFVASSGLIGRDGTDSRTRGRPRFLTERYTYQLGTKNSLEVDLIYAQNNTEIVKRFTFKKSKYSV